MENRGFKMLLSENVFPKSIQSPNHRNSKVRFLNDFYCKNK